MKVEITRKGNVKVDGIKYVFVRGIETCELCAFAKIEDACNAAPCVPNARVKLHLPAHIGYFVKKESKQ